METITGDVVPFRDLDDEAENYYVEVFTKVRVEAASLDAAIVGMLELHHSTYSDWNLDDIHVETSEAHITVRFFATGRMSKTVSVLPAEDGDEG